MCHIINCSAIEIYRSTWSITNKMASFAIIQVIPTTSFFLVAFVLEHTGLSSAFFLPLLSFDFFVLFCFFLMDLFVISIHLMTGFEYLIPKLRQKGCRSFVIFICSFNSSLHCQLWNKLIKKETQNTVLTNILHYHQWLERLKNLR